MPEITLLLHNIRSTHNVGSIFRSAEGFSVTKIILTGYTPYPTTANDSRLPHIRDKQTAQIHKTALGAEAMLPFEQYDDIYDWFTKNDRSTKLPIIGLEQAADSVRLQDFVPPSAFALLLGEEVHGLTADLLDKCTNTIEIPMAGKKESFNVSVATAITLYEFQRS